MHKIAVIIYGPPGSGKGTQANLLASRTDLMHFDTGRFLESVVHDPRRQKQKIVVRERRLFDSGRLMTPSFVLREVKREVGRIARSGAGLIFSGSPRTVYEAEGLFPALKKLYGRNNIFIFELKVPDSVSIKRNSERMICSVCNQALLVAYYPKTKKPPKHCLVCGGLLYKRVLDNAKVIKVRLIEYRGRTMPVIRMARAMGFRVVAIKGTTAPYMVFKDIYAKIRR